MGRSISFIFVMDIKIPQQRTPSYYADHIVIKHIDAQSLIPKLDEIKLLIENEDLYIL